MAVTEGPPDEKLVEEESRRTERVDGSARDATKDAHDAAELNSTHKGGLTATTSQYAAFSTGDAGSVLLSLPLEG